MGNKSSLMLQEAEIQQISGETGFSTQQIEKLYSRFAHLDRGNNGSLSRDDLISIPELAINPLCDRLIHVFFTDSGQNDGRISFKQFMKVLAVFRSNNSNNSSQTNEKSIETQALQINETLNHRRSLGTTVQALTSGTMKDSTSKQQKQGDISMRDNELVYKTNSNSKAVCLNESLRNKLLFVFRVYDADNDGLLSFRDLRSILKMMVGNHIEDAQLDKIATRAIIEVDKDNDGFIEFSDFCKVFSGKDLDDKLRVKFFN